MKVKQLLPPTPGVDVADRAHQQASPPDPAIAEPAPHPDTLAGRIGHRLAATSAHAPVIVHASDKGAVFPVSELWRYRDLILLFAARDVKLRFRQTKLGAWWLVIGPLFLSGAWSFLFGSVGHVNIGGNNYFVYTYVGLSLWNAFANGFNRISNCLLLNKDLLTQVYFPRLGIPFGSMVASQIDVLISWVMLTALMLIGHEHFGLRLLLIPVWVFVIQVYALDIGLLIASWTIAIRDLQNIIGLAVAVGPIITPIAYPASALPQHLQFIATINPLSPLFDAMRWSCLGAAFPSAGAMAYTALAAVAFTFWSARTFRKAERSLADFI